MEVRASVVLCVYVFVYLVRSSGLLPKHTFLSPFLTCFVPDGLLIGLIILLDAYEFTGLCVSPHGVLVISVISCNGCSLNRNQHNRGNQV